MNRIARFVIWICSKFNRTEIFQIISGLQDVLADRNPEIKPKDDFKEKHPNYRNFYVDPLPPLTQQPSKQPDPPHLDWRHLLKDYQQQHGKPLKPVRRHMNLSVPNQCQCQHCGAPAQYLYYNDGKKRRQLRCKVCGLFFQAHKRFHPTKKTKYFCPHCHMALYRWKNQKVITIYKCGNDRCPAFIKAKNRLNDSEKQQQKKKLSQFKLRYQYRQYHFAPAELKHSGPDKPRINLSRIHNSSNILGLVLAFHISCAVSARKTAFVLQNIFNIPISYQTVLNYAEAASYHCHLFNIKNKGPIDSHSAGDEAYIKIRGNHHYVFFFISSKSLKITAYHLADNRDTLPATIAMMEAVRTATPDQKLTLITDGNPSYAAAIHFINALNDPSAPISHRKVIGLQNLDKESTTYRLYKQIIERLNRTYKFHVRPAHGFNYRNGAVALTTLFVTHYNFLRPHMSLNYQPPICIPELQSISTLQGKWNKILSLASP